MGKNGRDKKENVKQRDRGNDGREKKKVKKKKSFPIISKCEPREITERDQQCKEERKKKPLTIKLKAMMSSLIVKMRVTFMK